MNLYLYLIFLSGYFYLVKNAVGSTLANTLIICKIYNDQTKTLQSKGLLLLILSYILLHTNDIKVHLLLLPEAVILALTIILLQMYFKRLIVKITTTDDPSFFNIDVKWTLSFAHLKEFTLGTNRELPIMFHEMVYLLTTIIQVHYSVEVICDIFPAIIEVSKRLFINLNHMRNNEGLELSSFTPHDWDIKN